MRALLYCVDMTSKEKRDLSQEIRKKMEETYGGFVILDFFEDIEMAEYCAMVRIYDLIYIASGKEANPHTLFSASINILGEVNKAGYETTAIIQHHKQHSFAVEKILDHVLTNFDKVYVYFTDKDPHISFMNWMDFVINNVLKESRNMPIKIHKIDPIRKSIVFSMQGREAVSMHLKKISNMRAFLALARFCTNGKSLSVFDLFSFIEHEPEEATIVSAERCINFFKNTCSHLFSIHSKKNSYILKPITV